MNKILVIIPARGDSKEVPNKNIKKIEKLYKKLKEKQAQKSAQNSA